MAAFASMYVWFQGCSMRVVEVDGIYTEAAETNMLYLTAGQRYSVLLTVDSNAVTNIPFVASMDEVRLQVPDSVLQLTSLKELFDAIPDDLNMNATGWLVIDGAGKLPEPLQLDDFDAFDDISLRPLDSLAALPKVDRTITLDMKMDNLGDGAN
jgi:iron transport multicopper oxidase